MKIRLWPTTIVIALVVLLTARAGQAANETHVYGIAQFGHSGECGSKDDTHPVHTETAAAFASWFSDLKVQGKWDHVLTRNNRLARGSYFTDARKAFSCICVGDDSHSDRGADEADVIYVHTHGSHTASPPHTTLSMGNKVYDGYDCTVRTDNNMLWNDDLDVAVIKACQSADYDVWKDGGYRQKFTNKDSSLRIWNAFHGDSSCGSHVTTYVRWYAMSSTYDGVGENWLDAAYDVNWGSNNDDCPVSIVMGSTSAKRVDFFENGGWRDRKDTGKKTSSSYFYFEGCNPDNGYKLPSD